MKCFYLVFLLVALALPMLFVSSCGNDSKDDTGRGLDVRFEVPAEITLAEGADELQFRIMFSKAPKISDVILLKDYSGVYNECPVINVSGNNFTVRLYDGITDGKFDVYISRGDEKKMMGSTVISFESDIDLEKETTVYGFVCCGDKGLEDVVVSDGISVVKTDANGLYQLNSAKEYGYVFVSVPSGYTTAGDGFLPAIHRMLLKSPSSLERADFNLVEDGDQTNHTMLVFGDLHLANRTKDISQFGSFTADVNRWVSANKGNKIYGLTLGDLTWDIYWVTNKYDLDDYVESMSAIKDIKIYQTIGNHDHSCYIAGDFGSASPFREKIAPTFYSYNVGKVHYVVLDDIVANNTGNYNDSSHGRNHVSELSNDNIEWLKKDLAFVPKSTPVVVAMHAPVYSDLGLPSVRNFAALISALDGYQVHFLTGHTHKMYNVEHVSQNIFEHNSAAVCATWWWTGNNIPGIHICQDGTPGGYRIFNVNGTEFNWTYKATGSSTDYQFRTYDGNEVYMPSDKYCSKASDEGKKIYEKYAKDWITESNDNYVYINIWDYDPSWDVSVTENGTELKWDKISGTDPLHLLAYTAVSVNGNSKEPTFPTSSTRHIFRVKASSPTSTLEIKVTDRFGNVYTESMKRPKTFDADTYKR